MKGSWKTTAAAIIGAVAMIIGEACDAVGVQVDALATNGKFEVPVIIAALGILGIGWFARDKDVSTEQQKAADTK
jgi:chromate transport protein ChrA